MCRGENRSEMSSSRHMGTSDKRTACAKAPGQGRGSKEAGVENEGEW